MKKIALILLLLVAFSSCKSSKRVVTTKSKTTKIDRRSTPSAPANPLAENIIDYAMKFEGVKYKYGGTTKKGMDCSGLIVTSFNSENIALPRTTTDMAVAGDWIDLKEVVKGDLLFFATQRNSRKVSHVGIVTEARDGNVEFIHASTSNGVIVSNLAEKYWYFAFVQARRVL
ncbi:C40 family peptidase [uncultured Gelidibacter sp.]|uniref:C40 family peptidase n=1 Tax=uncultured Gelidibacter sp. TaxID=259318 RepID=UPI002606CF64|nr:C40 family peptidase [uncultured Gelidibacter sp.]